MSLRPGEAKVTGTMGNVGMAAAVIGGTAVLGGVGGALMGRFAPAERDTGTADDGLRGVEVDNTLRMAGLTLVAGGVLAGVSHGMHTGFGRASLGYGLAGGLAMGGAMLTAGLAYEALT